MFKGVVNSPSLFYGNHTEGHCLLNVHQDAVAGHVGDTLVPKTELEMYMMC